ncbi:hypothetical protein Tharo_2649 [Thauera aromatica K172]|uniref:Uncharacterized protein n=2 Tax=Thauera aromatica TaxID=59405 RepID=A0A2R4BQB8_THAAR|nr:hypothetical protein Tharo_2649 [Thauera aromatica K172]
MHTALCTLYERAKDGMTIQELETVAQLTELAGDEARRLSALCEGVACLVLSGEEAPCSAGSFQTPGGLFDLLCSLAHSLDAIGGLVEIGQEADRRVRMQLAGDEVRS